MIRAFYAKLVTYLFLLVLTMLSGVQLYAVEELEDAAPEYIKEYTDKASKAYGEQKYNESLDFIRHVIKSDMTNYELRMLAAHNHWRLKNYEPATAHFYNAMAARPDSAGVYTDLAMMLLQMGEPQKAREIGGKGLEKLLAAQKEVPAKLYNVIARCALQLGDTVAAVAHSSSAKAAAATDPNKANSQKDKLEAVIIEGRAQMAVGNFDKAELSLSWADSIRPENVYTQNLLGYLYEKWAASTTRPEKKKEYLAKSREQYTLALANSNLPDALEPLIKSNLARLGAE